MTFQNPRIPALAAFALLCASCSVHHDRFKSRGSEVTVDVKSISLKSDRLQTSLDISSIKVDKAEGKHPCDVKIWIQADADGDGAISDSEKREVHSSNGPFQGFQASSVKLQIQGEVKSATLVVETRDAKDKDRDPERLSFGINRDGIYRLSRDVPTSIVFTSGRASDHFVELTHVGSDGVEVSIGDLRARSGGTLSNLTRGGRPDFLGAAVFSNDQLIALLGGRDVVSARLPQLKGPLGKLRIVTLDRALRVCADFSLDALRVQ